MWKTTDLFSVLPTVSKLLERIMQNQIISHLISKIIYPPIFADIGKAMVPNML